MGSARVLVTGAKGMLGSAISRKFTLEGLDVIELTREKVDLLDAESTFDFINRSKPNLIVHCAAVVGGIQASISMGSKYFIDNTRIDQSVLFASRKSEIENFIYIASSCMYPANISHPLKEQEILTGPLEPTNEEYAIAKIVGTRLTQAIAKLDSRNWRVLIPSNLYGPNDNFDPGRAHLLAAIIRKGIEARELGLRTVDMWGDGTPRREFTHVDDFAQWVYRSSRFLEKTPPLLNIGYGRDYSVREFYEFVFSALEWDAEIVSNPQMPNGNMMKLMDSSEAISLGWKPEITIEQGILSTIDWYLANRKGS